MTTVTDDSRDTRDLSLSPYQQQFFEGWIRASRAIPPPFMVAVEYGRREPQMSSAQTIDLVQDAATDCSVVTSLCAAIARGERGHDQVREFPSPIVSMLISADANQQIISFR